MIHSLTERKMMEKVKADVWVHHDTMISDLKGWIDREVNLLRTDISKSASGINAATSKILKNAEDLYTQAFDLIQSVSDMAEKESKKNPDKG